tara:strand:- start:372 stop:1886 length:1515 start_codon:yes stop_codon:yes gene_type:complete
MSVLDLGWSWAQAVDGRTPAGMVVAMDDVARPGTVRLFGMLADRSGGVPECSISGGQWVRAVVDADPVGTGWSGLAVADGYQRRFGVSHPDKPWLDAVIRDAAHRPATAMLRCQLGDSGPLAGRRLSLRSGFWRLELTTISQEQWAPSTTTGSSDGNASMQVCMPYAWGEGRGAPSPSMLLEYVTWYVLLGADRVVIFDDFDNRTAPGALALSALAEAKHLQGRVLVVRGLCLADTQRRAPLHESCQVLSNNLCRHLAGASGYVLGLDQDELLAPSAKLSPLPSIDGALRSLTRTLEAGGTITGSAMSKVRPRLQRPEQGRGRCALFAGVSYYPCIGREASRAQDFESARIFRMPTRGTPVTFEEGPSHLWQHVRTWGGEVKAKFLMSTEGDETVLGIHHCCIATASSSGQRGCATIEHVPIEAWHVRHLRARDDAEGCRAPPRRAELAVAPKSSTQIVQNGSHLHWEPLPAEWVDAYSRALREARASMQRVAPRLQWTQLPAA